MNISFDPSVNRPFITRTELERAEHGKRLELEALHAAVTEAHALRTATREGRSDLYARFSKLVNSRTPVEPRDLLVAHPARAARSRAASAP